MKDLNAREKTIKILEENTGNLFDISHSNFLLDISPEAREMSYWDFIKIKISAQLRNNQHTKRHPMEWEKIFVNDISDKGLVFKIYKELTKLNTQKTMEPVKKWAEDMNRYFSKEDMQMANRHMKRHST